MKVSIIMPIYNAEKYLEKSLDSIVNQSYKNIELILVNDGSTDDSKYICRKYQEKDSRIKLIDIKNSGPGFARNIGIENARGDYISFVDADDWLELDAIETLLNISILHNYDLVSSNHFRVDDDIRVSKNNYKTGELSETYDSFKVSSSFGYVWGKLYRKRFIDDCKISFNEDRDVFLEDTLFNLKVIAYNPKYYVLNKALYYYNIREDSLSNTSEDITDKAKKLLRDYERFLDDKDLYHENLDLFIPLTARTIAWSLFKSMDHKFNLSNIYKRVNEFSKDATIRRLVKEKESLKELRKLDSILQMLLYAFIIISIRFKLEVVLSLVFYMFYPIFSIYIKKVLKN